MISHTLRGCVDWNLVQYNVCAYVSSHPAWVCGLKLTPYRINQILGGHTLRGCVDWNLYWASESAPWAVTPCVGVWIETYHQVTGDISPESHPAWVCGLKQLRKKIILLNLSHTLRGCVDWNLSSWYSLDWSNSHTLRGCVDWNLCLIISRQNVEVTPCVGVWIETTKVQPFSKNPTVTPCVGVWIETLILITLDQPPIVTPCVGVWIETVMYDESPDGDLSHPAWVCGLKLTGTKVWFFFVFVTPCVGVWIETCFNDKHNTTGVVTPCVGVWIETSY